MSHIIKKIKINKLHIHLLCLKSINHNLSKKKNPPITLINYHISLLILCNNFKILIVFSFYVYPIGFTIKQ